MEGQLVGLREEGLGGEWPAGHLEWGVSGPGVGAGQCLLPELSLFFQQVPAALSCASGLCLWFRAVP